MACRVPVEGEGPGMDESYDAGGRGGHGGVVDSVGVLRLDRNCSSEELQWMAAVVEDVLDDLGGAKKCQTLSK